VHALPPIVPNREGAKNTSIWHYIEDNLFGGHWATDLTKGRENGSRKLAKTKDEKTVEIARGYATSRTGTGPLPVDFRIRYLLDVLQSAQKGAAANFGLTAK